MPDITALEAFAKLGAHFVLADNDKKAIQTSWQQAAPPFEVVKAHAAKGNLVGIIPASLGLAVVDVDEGGHKPGVVAVTDTLGAPISVTESRQEDRYHVWYRAPDREVRNSNWRIGEAAGQVRGSKGYVILWPDALDKLPGDLDRFFEAAQPVDPSKLPKSKKQQRRRDSPRGRSAPNGSLGLCGPDAVLNASEGERNETLNLKVFQAARAGETDFTDYKLAARAAGLSEEEIEATIASAAGAGAEVARPVLTKDRDGLREALRQLRVELRYNERAGKAEMRCAGRKWTELTDRKEAGWSEEIAARFDTMTTRGVVPLRFGRERRTDCVNAILDMFEVDPFREWLEALPPWDGEQRVDKWMVDLFEADDADPLVKWASRFVFLGAIWRTYEPGTKLDEMVVLVGEQGRGKSTAVRLALPPEHPEWFADGLHLADDPKKRAEALQGRVIVEAAEMAGTNRAELESLKAFLSRTDDGCMRMAYRRNPETMLRRCIIVGTTNSDHPLPNDPTGNRRFVPVRLPCGDPATVTHYMDRNRVQLWAEALALYRDRVQAWLPRDLHPEQKEAAEQHRRRDELIEDMVAGLHKSRAGVPLAQIAVSCGLIEMQSQAAKLDMRTQRRLGAALRHAGWAQRDNRRKGGGRSDWVYEGPDL